MADFGEKNWHSFDYEMKKRFGGKIYRLALRCSNSCPNRDGSCGTGGCIFCSADGSGDFIRGGFDVKKQLAEAKALVQKKLSKNFAGYMAYFQAFTGTYGDIAVIRAALLEAAEDPEVVALSIGTRPDCVGQEVISMLQEVHAMKPLSVELGLQTIHEETASYINRCYPLPVFEEAVRRLKNAGLEVIVHVIAGLPEEEEERTLETVRYLAQLQWAGAPAIDGIKLSLLYLIKGTVLEQRFQSGGAVLSADERWLLLSDGHRVPNYTLERYIYLLSDIIKELPPEMVLHRITGDAPKRLLTWPLWTADKKRVLNSIEQYLREKEIHQGSCVREKL